MNHPNHKLDPAHQSPNIFDEADIGSGEKSPGEVETEEMIRQIPPLPSSSRQSDAAGQNATGEQDKA